MARVEFPRDPERITQALMPWEPDLALDNALQELQEHRVRLATRREELNVEHHGAALAQARVQRRALDAIALEDRRQHLDSELKHKQALRRLELKCLEDGLKHKQALRRLELKRLEDQQALGPLDSEPPAKRPRAEPVD